MDVGNSSSQMWRIAVLSGGHTAERAVSLESGSNVAAALAAGGHFVDLIDPAVTDLLGVDWSQFDAVFIALHGAFGEDGSIQDLLDGVGIPYTGSCASASRSAFDKSVAKERFLEEEVPTPEYAIALRRDPLPAIRKAAERLGYPIVVKPNSQGSSFGVSLVRQADQLEAALQLAFEYDDKVLLEVAILGEEWTVPLVNRQILPAIRVSTQRELFDYQAKYLDEETGYVFAATSTQATLRAVEDAARRACAALGTGGIARVDIRLDAQQRPFVLEVNTIPGMTSHSLVPKSAGRLGWTMTDLCERAIWQALQDAQGAHNRHESRRPHAASGFAQTG